MVLGKKFPKLENRKNTLLKCHNIRKRRITFKKKKKNTTKAKVEKNELGKLARAKKAGM